ncbi:MAG: TetR/AcrR family transcriptional regulator [Myxococcota bacterium]
MTINQVRNKILEEAVRLFSRNGYGSTSVRELAEAAGITKPTLYYHFGSKEGLFEALVDHHLEGFEQLVDNTVNLPGTVVERLRWFSETYLLGGAEKDDALRFLMSCSLPEASDSPNPNCHVFARVLQIVTPLQDVIRQGMTTGELREDLDPNAAVLALLGALNLHLTTTLKGRKVDGGTVDSILNLWFHGVAA